MRHQPNRRHRVRPGESEKGAGERSRPTHGLKQGRAETLVEWTRTLQRTYTAGLLPYSPLEARTM